MSIFNNKTLWLTLLLLLAAGCSSAPKPVPQPEPEPVAEAAPVEEVVVEEVPVDFNQEFYEEAIAELKAGETELALELLVQVSNDAPDKPRVFTNLGLAYLKMQQLDLAEQAFNQAVSRDDRDPVAHNHLGVLQRQKGQFESARDHYQRAIKINSDYASAHLNLGILFDIYLQDLELALQQYQKYQTLISQEDTTVKGWIVDIQRRLKTNTTKSQG
jgi:Flp pilus assembly protein TadD